MPATSRIYSFKSVRNGNGSTFHRPVFASAIFVVIFDAESGKFLDKTLWKDSSTFYRSPPANYYAKFWHDSALGGLARQSAVPTCRDWLVGSGAVGTVETADFTR
jgi:hypothetical protein